MIEDNEEKSTDERKWLLDEVNFRKIVELQRNINEKTEISPSFRMLLNKIVEQADVSKLQKEMIEKLTMN